MPRYIDTKNNTFPTFHQRELNDYMKGWNSCLKSVLQQPTIDVAEVKHGYWRPQYISGTSLRNGMVSSCCDMWNERPTPFCPHCGAKMNGKEDNQ